MRTPCLVCGIVFLCSLGLSLSAFGESATNPEWIWETGRRNSDRTLFFRKEFSLKKPVVKAELLGATDFNRSLVYVNGQLAGELPSFGLPLRMDVANRINPGANVLAIHSQTSDGPSAVALQLELQFHDGTQEIISTDETWILSAQPEKGWREAEFKPSTAWKTAQSYGRVSDEMLPDPAIDTAINPLDDYTQWKQALGSETGTDPSTFSVAEGFEIERLRLATPEEGSWISIAFDPKGRLIVAREERGLLRMTIPQQAGEIQVETINDTLLECRGLLYAHDSLYASANNSKGLYRLRDTNGDDRFDEVKLLYQSEGGGVGHGRNDLSLGPDGKIYSINGDAVELPGNFVDRCSPFREHSRGQRSSEGHVLRFDPDGSHGEIVAAGLRNPYGIAMHPSGELFTYDADAEYDMGSPWYRPTRIVHLTPGSDYGWRGVTKSWPPYYPDHADNAPPVLDIGKGSPTGIKFGTKSRFPKRYRDSLFVSDWAYGRILAVRLTPRGGSFAGRADTFLKGQPFNVTDLDFGPDGAMYIVTGGRKTQSALYRVRHVGPRETAPALTPQQLAREKHAERSRKLRHQLEELTGPDAKDAIEAAWPHLNSDDPWIRHAAMTAVEHQPIAQWRQRALAETQTTASLAALMCLVRDPDGHSQHEIWQRLIRTNLSELTEPQLLMALATLQLGLQSNFTPPLAESTEISRALFRMFPLQSARGNLAITQVLSRLESSALVPELLDWLPQVEEQSSRMQALFVLRNAKLGWTMDQRRNYFKALVSMREFQGGEGMPTFIRRIEADALDSLDKSLRPEFEELLKRPASEQEVRVKPRPFVRAWSSRDLAGDLAALGGKHDFARGKRIFREALCARCHRVGFEGGSVGPDLTSVSRRFSRADILESIVSPSKVVAEQYRLAKIITTKGETLTGQIIPSRDYRSPELLLATKPLEPFDLTEISKAEIESFAMSPTSVMPNDLLNGFTKEEILDLIAWLEAGGNPKHPNFR